MVRKKKIIKDFQKWRKTDRTIYHSLSSITLDEVAEYTKQKIDLTLLEVNEVIEKLPKEVVGIEEKMISAKLLKKELGIRE